MRAALHRFVAGSTSRPARWNWPAIAAVGGSAAFWLVLLKGCL